MLVIESKKSAKSFLPIAIMEHIFISLILFISSPIFVFALNLRRRGNYKTPSVFEPLMMYMLENSLNFSLIVLALIVSINILYYLYKMDLNYIYKITFDDGSKTVFISYKYRYSNKEITTDVPYVDLKYSISEKETWYTRGKKSKVVKLFNKGFYKGQIFQEDYLWSNDRESLNSIIFKLNNLVK